MSVTSLFHAVVNGAHTAITSLAAHLGPFAGGLAPDVALAVFALRAPAPLPPLTCQQIPPDRRRPKPATAIPEPRSEHTAPVERPTPTLASQRQHGIGPFAGLLPALAQAPF